MPCRDAHSCAIISVADKPGPNSWVETAFSQREILQRPRDSSLSYRVTTADDVTESRTVPLHSAFEKLGYAKTISMGINSRAGESKGQPSVLGRLDYQRYKIVSQHTDTALDAI
jgi:hypothetical protein